MNMIRHDHPSMQIAVSPGAMQDGIADQTGDFWPLQMDRSKTSGIEQPVHSDERLPGGHALFRERAANRQAAMEPKCHEKRLPNSVDVWQTTL